MRKKEPYIFRNDVLQCPECKLEIAAAARDIFSGEALMRKDFIWKVPMPLPHTKTRCIECGSSYACGGRPYIKGAGWLE